MKLKLMHTKQYFVFHISLYHYTLSIVFIIIISSGWSRFGSSRW